MGFIWYIIFGTDPTCSTEIVELKSGCLWCFLTYTCSFKHGEQSLNSKVLPFHLDYHL